MALSSLAEAGGEAEAEAEGEAEARVQAEEGEAEARVQAEATEGMLKKRMNLLVVRAYYHYCAFFASNDKLNI